jgi:hypothetical protein
MADENDKCWTQALPKLRRAAGLAPLTREESEKGCKSSKLANLPDAKIDAIMEFVLSCGEKGGLGAQTPVHDDVMETASADAEAMDAELMELVNRNKGEQDQVSEELLKKHRAEALGQNAERERTNGDSKNKTGTGGGTDSPGTGC